MTTATLRSPWRGVPATRIRGAIVQQRQCVSGYRITQPRQPSRVLTRERFQVAPDDFDEQQLAEAKQHASSPWLPFLRFGERQLHELRQPALCARPWLAAQMEHARQRFEDWIERTDVTAEESADRMRLVRGHLRLPSPSRAPTRSP